MVAWTRVMREVGGEKWVNPKYILEVESTVFVNELDVGDEKEGGVKNDRSDHRPVRQPWEKLLPCPGGLTFFSLP